MHALEELGYKKVHHMSGVFQNPQEADFWTAAIEAKFEGKSAKFDREAWDHMLGNCMAVTDIPAAIFHAELIAAYPNAKVVLTTRNVDSWYVSMMQTVYKIYTSRFLRCLALINAKGAPMMRLHRAYHRALWGNNFPKNGKRFFKEHNDYVRSITPPERFLEFEASMGWEPLCTFLGKDVPKTEYPRVNDLKAFKGMQKTRAGMAARGLLKGVVVMVILPTLVVGGAIWWGVGRSW
ncbi:hypothetical protein MMC30_006219 [Trapelia coarctata]|nr:hypothetical protein [Trapelia coarctata]